MYGVSLTAIYGKRDITVLGIAFDSRKVQKGYLFIAVKGLTVDGHDYIGQALKKGAKAVVAEVVEDESGNEATYIKTDNSARALGIIASNFYGNPSKKLDLIGITGTNGKTTNVTLLHGLFTALGYKVGLLSTVNNKIGTETIPASYTTPDAIEINAFLAKMVKAGCTHAFMEVSSHALVQERVSGISFKGAVFTNISHDHLDYHGSFEEYIKAKKKLFDELPSSAFALVNADDKRGAIMLQNSKANKYRFAIKSIGDYRAKLLHNTLQGLELEVGGTTVWFKLIGSFNAYNILSVYCVAILLGEDKSDVLTQLSQLAAVPGRFEYVENRSNVLAIVDYAHTPDALEKVLTTIQELRTKNELVITVVGCGGDRDREKRPKMAGIAQKYSEKVILTSDNPRNEDPEKIIDDMFKGISKSGESKTMKIVDRKEAIRTACNLARDNDIILVAGKGHENYQDIAGVKHHFDDKEMLDQMLNQG